MNKRRSQLMGDGNWVVSASGFIDTSTHAGKLLEPGDFVRPRLVCTRSGGTSMTIPASSAATAHVVLTKLDNVENVVTGGNGVPSR